MKLPHPVNPEESDFLRHPRIRGTVHIGKLCLDVDFSGPVDDPQDPDFFCANLYADYTPGNANKLTEAVALLIRNEALDLAKVIRTAERFEADQ